MDPNDLDANVGADRVLFATVVLDGSAPPPQLTVSGSPFPYDPSLGNLLLDIVVLESLGRGTPGDDSDAATFAARDGDAAGVISRAFSPSGNAIGRQGRGYVNEFVPVPEPGSLALGGLVLAPLVALRRRSRRR